MEIVMKKYFSGFLAVLMLLSVVALLGACNKITDDEGAQTTVTPPAEDVLTGILVSDLKNLKIIYSETETQPTAKLICDAIEQKFGFRPVVRSSFVNNSVPEFAEAEFEILVGKCDYREESEEFFATVRVKDYGYSLVNKKIVVAGGSPELIKTAAEHLISNVIEKCDSSAEDSFFFRSDSGFLHADTYSLDSLKINGTSVSEYVLVYPEAENAIEKNYAGSLAYKLESYSGYSLRIKSDDQLLDRSAKEIRIGATNRNPKIDTSVQLGANEFYIGQGSDGAIEIYASSTQGYVGAINKLYSMMTTGDKIIDMSITEAIKGTNTAKALTSMSFNILTTKPSDARFAAVVKRITDVMPDTVGLQEVSPYWMSKLKPELAKHNYDVVGVDRNDDGTGEYSCIFYRKDLFVLKESGTKWLSDTPDVFSKYSESSYPRIFTYVKLQRKSDGALFVHINTHLDHVGGMAKQAKVLTTFADSFGNIPIVMTGDYNSVPNSSAYKAIVGAGYSDLSLVAEDTVETATFYSGSRIDYFFGNVSIVPESYRVDNVGFSGKDPSDHYPLILKFYI